MDVSNVIAVIVTFNRKELLCQVLDAILQQDCGSPDILIVDNGSTDGTKSAIEPYLSNKNITYENTGANLGGAGGFNRGMKIAVARGYERLWIMDDDCVPEPSALSALLQADNQLEGKFGWLSSVVFWLDGNLCKLNMQKSRYWKRAKLNDCDLQEVQFASFVSLYVPVSVIKKTGFVISDFYIWGDDTEFSRRISAHAPCFVVKKSRVIHKTTHNHGVNISSDDPDRIWRYQYTYRNEVYIMRREGLRGYVFFITKLIYHTIRVLLCSKDNRCKKLGIIYKSVWEGLHFNPSIEYADKNSINKN